MKAYLITMFIILIIEATANVVQAFSDESINDCTRSIVKLLRFIMCIGITIWTGFLLF